MIHSFTANVLAPVASTIYDASYETTKGLENYWLRGGKGMGLNYGKEITSCDGYRQQTTMMPNIAGVKQQICDVATKYNIPYQVLWGTFKIEGGRARSRAYNGGGTVACSVNSVGAVGPLQHLEDICRPGQISQENEAQGKNVCDFNIGLDVTAQIYKRFTNDPNYQYADGKPNWYWITGEYNMGGKVTGFGPKCEGAPATDGCNGANYCVCAIETFADEISCPNAPELLNI